VNEADRRLVPDADNPAGPTQASGNSSGPQARYNLCRWRKPPVRSRIHDDQARRADTIGPVSALQAWRSSHRAFDRGLSAPAEAVPGPRPLAHHGVGLHTTNSTQANTIG
jgi:hypothetical protein